MRFRLAKPGDAGQIASVHYHIRDKYAEGFFAKVNYCFLKQYYIVMLNDPNEVVVCAENESGKILGFNSGSLNTEKQFDSMKKHKMRFLFPLLTSAIKNPKLIKSALDRYESTQNKSNNHYISSKGARGEYWGWLSDNRDAESSVIMHEVWINVMKSLGVKDIFFEVDKVNKKIFQFHKINGAKILNSFILSDGRERIEMVYNLDSYKFKFIK